MAEQDKRARDGQEQAPKYERNFSGFVQAISTAIHNTRRSRAFTTKKERNMYARTVRSTIHLGLGVGPSPTETIRSIRHSAANDEGPGDPLQGATEAARARLMNNARVAWGLYSLLICLGFLILDTDHEPAVIRINVVVSAIAIVLAGMHLMLRASRDYWSMRLARKVSIRQQLANPDEFAMPWSRHSVGKYLAAAMMLIIIAGGLYFLVRGI